MVAALLFAVLAVPVQAQNEAYQVSISQFVEHPALDAVLKGFQDYLTETGVDAVYTIHNAQANMATAGQIGRVT